MLLMHYEFKKLKLHKVYFHKEVINFLVDGKVNRLQKVDKGLILYSLEVEYLLSQVHQQDECWDSKILKKPLYLHH